MHDSNGASLTPSVALKLLQDHKWLWLAPALAGLVLTAVVTLVTPRQWQASQGLIVRSETAGYDEQRLGKFTDLSELRTVQETLLEVARSRTVISAALQAVAKPGWFSSTPAKPTASQIDQLRENLKITPPGGSEFGATEVFYLSVVDSNVDRAVQLCDQVCHELEKRMQHLRIQQATSMVVELEHASEAARGSLHEQTQKLAQLETEVGADLADLRNLISPTGGRGALAEKVLSIEAILRENTSTRQRNEQLLKTLKQAQADPGRLLATPSSLLALQPAIQRLKDGLVDAQIRAASLKASRSESHPSVVAINHAQQLLSHQLRSELPSAIAGVRMELSLADQREAALKAELSGVQQRIRGLALRRADYSQLVAAVENQSRLVDAAEAQLADARAYSAGASSVSVLERVDTVEAGTNPLGPGRVVVTLAGGFGGLLLGLGLVYGLHAPTPAQADTVVPQAEGPQLATWQSIQSDSFIAPALDDKCGWSEVSTGGWSQPTASA